MHAANRGCKNYPCSIALRADWKINRYHLARLVSSNRDWFAYYRHTTPIFTHSLYVYAGETIMPPRVLASGPKPCGGNNFTCVSNFHTFQRHKTILPRWHLPEGTTRTNFIYTSHHFTAREDMNSINWPRSQMCGFIARLVEHRTGISEQVSEVTGSNPVEALIFFRLTPSSCLNWKIYCDDRSPLSSTSAVQIWIISIYTSQKRLSCCQPRSK